GVYVMIEQVDKAYLERNFGSGEGNLYKASFGFDTMWQGPNPELYQDIGAEKKTNEEENDWSDIVELLDILNNTPDDEFPDEIEGILNVDGFLSYLAANAVLSNMDSLVGDSCNFYLYNNPSTGLFELIPWDLNGAFGNHNVSHESGNGLTADEMIALDIEEPVTQGEEHLLIERVLAVDDYMDAYLDKVADLVAGEFSPTQMNASFDDMHGVIEEAVYADKYKEFSDEAFASSLTTDLPDSDDPGRVLGLKPFVADRNAAIADQLDESLER
ncbi:MAG: hypothetical protein HN348_17375, partial [Proteobacteria bacterium]|nr:hypothetical protein [Pseudomonadota bacterium]